MLYITFAAYNNSHPFLINTHTHTLTQQYVHASINLYIIFFYNVETLEKKINLFIIEKKKKTNHKTPILKTRRYFRIEHLLLYGIQYIYV